MIRLIPRSLLNPNPHLLFIFIMLIFISTPELMARGDDKVQRIKYNNSGLVTDLGVGLWAWPLPVDFDGDGDNDLLVNCPDKPYNGIYFFENINGNIKMPVFKPGKKIGKGHRNIQISHLNNSFKFLIPGFEITSLPKSKTIEIYPEENIYDKNKKIRANQWKYCDYNGDGAVDIIVSIGDWSDYGWDNAFDENGIWQNGPLHGFLFVLKNIGSNSKPEYNKPAQIFAGDKPIDVYGMPSANLADFDNDGDLDIICGEFLDKFTYFENIGSRTDPVYAEGKYLSYNHTPIKMDLEMIVPTSIDWDKDGDVDLIVGQEDGRVAFLENTGIIDNGIPQFELPEFFKQEADDVKFGALVTPFNVDWDNDGDEDLICGNTAGYIGFIENLNGANPPSWAEPVLLKADGEVIRIQAGENGSIQGPAEAKWGYTTLSVGDWDGDGLHDIMINSILGKIMWFRNKGTKEKPELASPESIKVEWNGTVPKPEWNWWDPENSNLVTQWRTTPFIIDWNSDKLTDLIMLDHEGYLSFFERSEVNGELLLHPGKRIFFNDNGEHLQLNERKAGRSGRRKFTIVDWDLDGKLDLLVNSKNTNFLRNISSVSDTVMFQDMGMVSNDTLAGHTTSPTIVDWNRNGIPDLLIGAEDGFFYYLKNPIDSNNTENTFSEHSRYLKSIETKVIWKEQDKYIGWPTITKTLSGELLTVFSGNREAHVCPFGKTQIIRSNDNGQTWSNPEIINNTPLDDRDAGILETVKGTLLVNWFTSLAFDRDRYFKKYPEWEQIRKGLDSSTIDYWLGNWTRRSLDNGETWLSPVKQLVSSPHGPIELKDGRILYVGTAVIDNEKKLAVEVSNDDGENWNLFSVIEIADHDTIKYYHEPHAVELENGKLVAMFRYQPKDRSDSYLRQSESYDGGKTWTKTHRTEIWGYPPHLIQLNNGWLMVAYGVRKYPFGEKACISKDGGETWDIENEIFLSKSENSDLGYPASVQLDDGSIITVFYQIDKKGEKTSLFQTHWEIND